MSEDSAQEATLIQNGSYNHHNSSSRQNKVEKDDQRTGEQKSETKKSNLFANMFIG